jgi:hypothetical protein
VVVAVVLLRLQVVLVETEQTQLETATVVEAVVQPLALEMEEMVAMVQMELL